ncbi:hypothetical protein [Pseudoduganella umbonata]|uniref:Uncharacterized protein n=1 Tax=Pseudoduganella umbonata TaxID=864828 RepID=A0A4P8HUZ7_9BURK|nr:hypothetical protein [Pseudoduganella umbonata]MBB3222056.1 hypothetical protein [Pseudoduganella umbonata]QCP12295.1 hypothetical protein FCL38_19135 [Pseudoduganella umbonata]
MEDASYDHVPTDFPLPAYWGAIPGAQPKLIMTKYNGRFYSPGCTPPEIFKRWSACEEIAKQLAKKSIESKIGKRAHMSELEILGQYLPRLIATKLTSEEEACWIIRRVAAILGWPVPSSAR